MEEPIGIPWPWPSRTCPDGVGQVVIREYKGKPAVVIRYMRNGSHDDRAIIPATVLLEVIEQLQAALKRLEEQ